MSDYPLWAYRQQLEHKFANELHNPLTDQGRAKDIKAAIDQKVQEFAVQQQVQHRRRVERLKRDMS